MTLYIGCVSKEGHIQFCKFGSHATAIFHVSWSLFSTTDFQTNQCSCYTDLLGVTLDNAITFLQTLVSSPETLSGG
jgi:hypothetical protein